MKIGICILYRNIRELQGIAALDYYTHIVKRVN